MVVGDEDDDDDDEEDDEDEIEDVVGESRDTDGFMGEESRDTDRGDKEGY